MRISVGKFILASLSQAPDRQDFGCITGIFINGKAVWEVEWDGVTALYLLAPITFHSDEERQIVLPHDKVEIIEDITKHPSHLITAHQNSEHYLKMIERNYPNYKELLAQTKDEEISS